MTDSDSASLKNYAGTIMIALVLLAIASALLRAEQDESSRVSLQAPHQSMATEAESEWQLWQRP